MQCSSCAGTLLLHHDAVKSALGPSMLSIWDGLTGAPRKWRFCPERMHVVQVTGSNVESVAESEVMRILILMRNFIEGYKQASASAHLPTACLHVHRP